MILYRFTHRKYAHDLSGNGAKQLGGRWNYPGTPVIYTSEFRSLALLEILANAGKLEDLQSLQLMEIHLPDQAEIQEILLPKLKKHWNQDLAYTQWLGTEMIRSGNTLVCCCPSSIIHQEKNYLINPVHPDCKKIRLLSSEDFYFDPRIFKQP